MAVSSFISLFFFSPLSPFSFFFLRCVSQVHSKVMGLGKSRKRVCGVRVCGCVQKRVCACAPFKGPA